MRPIRRLWDSNSGWRLARDRGLAETTERVRQLVDGIEGAIGAGDAPSVGTIRGTARTREVAWRDRRAQSGWGKVAAIPCRTVLEDVRPSGNGARGASGCGCDSKTGPKCRPGLGV